MRRSIEPLLSRTCCTCKCANIDDAADIDWVGCSESESDSESVLGFKDNCTTAKQVPRLSRLSESSHLINLLTL